MTHFAQSFQQPIKPQIQELIDIDFNVSLLYEDHGINSLQIYIQKMSIRANSRGLWSDNCAIFCLVDYLHRTIHVWSKNICVICFQTDDDFISNKTLQFLYHDDMVNARNGHYDPITFYNASWEVDQNMLPQTKHTNQPTTMSIKQRGQKRSLSLYGIDDNMHPQKQKIEVSHENVIKKPKHFHWKPMHNEQLEILMIAFPSSILKDIAKKILINNST
jgi:hypothetical protein